jgi:acyl-CoA synthetase (AMP-forming)/AMP-acid ligase II/thioesterase domain-containing protein
MKRKRTDSISEENARGSKVPKIPNTLLGLLERAATRWPDNGIRICQRVADDLGEFVSYPQLLAEAKVSSPLTHFSSAQSLTALKECARTLLSRSLVVPREPAVLYFEDNRASVVWYWATVIAGAIPALLPPIKGESITQTNFLAHVSGLLKRPPILTSKAFAATFESPEDNFQVFFVEDILPDSDSKLTTQLCDPGLGHEHDAVTLLFTSGSTGPSKAVEFTHAQLVASSQTKAQTNNMDSSKVFLSWISFDHSVSICELHLHAMFVGANQVMMTSSEMVKNAAGFWDAMSFHKIAYTFAPNSFLASANAAYEDDTEAALDKLDFSHLEILFCGGEANKVKTLEKTDIILSRHRGRPHAITPVYGLSETCSAIFYNRISPQHDVEQQYTFASVGSILPGNSVRLVDGKSTNVKAGEVGAIQLKGPLIFQKYYNNEAATHECMTEDGWFDTGDTGRIDKSGSLCIVGRTKEVLIINGQNYSSFDLEYAVEISVPGLKGGYTATFSVWLEETEAETEDLAILFNAEDKYAEDKVALRDLADKVTDAATKFCGKRPAIVIPVPVSCLPRSSIGKLSRSQLKKSLLAGHFDPYKIQAPEDQLAINDNVGLSPELCDAVKQVVRSTTAVINTNTTLASLGIDSLGHLRLKAAIERAISTTAPKLSLARLVGCRTLGEVDAYLSDVTSTNSGYDPIVELAPRGSKPTLILGHPGNGEVLLWLPLLPYLPDRRILALRARGFEEGETPFDSLDDMVTAYLAAIKKSEPQGPYCLFGRCFGGILVFELAKRLKAQGDEVLFLGSIDAPAQPSNFLKAYRQEKNTKILDLLRYLKVITLEQYQEWGIELAHLGPEEFPEAVLQRVPSLGKSGLSLPKLRNWIAIVMSLYSLVQGYTPQDKVAALDAFSRGAPSGSGCEDLEWHDKWMNEWNDLVVQDPEERVALQPGGSAGAGALRYHHIHSEVGEDEADYPASLGPILSECIGRREAERETKLVEG